MEKRSSSGSLLLGLLLWLLLAGLPANATHIIGGELTFHADTTNTSSLRYFFKLVLYQEAGNLFGNAQASLNFGDGTTGELLRSSRNLVEDNPSIYRSVYYGEHNFPALGTFIVYYKEVNRAIGFANITNSENIPYFIQASVTLGLQAAGNHSPVFIAPPITTGVLGQPFRHNVTAYDRDGDSLAYKLVPSLQNVYQPIISYQFPEGITMNNRTGEIIWSQTSKVGQYALAAEIREYRQGQLIGKVMRDFTVLIRPSGVSPDLQLVNPNQVPVNARNQVFITATTPVKIRVATTNAGKLVAYSELFTRTNVLASQIVADNPRTIELTIMPNTALRRSLPYIVIIRGTSNTPGPSPQQDLTVAVYFRPERTDDGQDTTEPGEKVNPTGNPETEEDTPGSGFSIFPNPVKAWFKINNNSEKPVTLLVYSATGQLVLNQLLNLPQTIIQRTSQIRPGIYFYVILSNTGKLEHSGKLVLL